MQAEIIAEDTLQGAYTSEVPEPLGTATSGTRNFAARTDHVHEMPKLDDTAAPDDNTDRNATTTSHGLLLKATAPAAGVRNVVCIDNAETAYKNAALLDSVAPAALGSAGSGSSLLAARRDHVHAMPSASDVGALSSSGGTLSGNLVVTGNFGCNGQSAQGAYSLGAAATDLPSVVALANSIRSALIAVGIGVA